MNLDTFNSKEIPNILYDLVSLELIYCRDFTVRNASGRKERVSFKSLFFVVVTVYPIRSLSDAGSELLGYSCLCMCPVSLSGHLKGFWLARETWWPSQSERTAPWWILKCVKAHTVHTLNTEQPGTHSHTRPSHDTHFQTSAQPLWRVENILD